VRFSIWPSGSQPWSELTDVVRHADATGWDRVYIADHFMLNGESADATTLEPTFEATALLAGLAASTARIGIAPLVLGITYRHPAVLAKWAATVDHMSAGRLVLGLGAGWQENEHQQYGIDLGPPRQRIDRFEEALVAIRGLLTDRETTLPGRHYQLARAIAEPKPVQPHLPILIGAKGDRMMRVVARHADEWNAWGLPARIAERRQALDRACERIGRDPAAIATSCQAVWSIDDTPSTGSDRAELARFPAVVSGTTDELAEHVAAWRSAGADEVIVPDFALGRGSARAERMDAVIERIAPAFRS
jgi:F420-dependent oxidoreductase-like protein